MKKSLRECAQITFVIVQYHGTKFKLICVAQKVAKAIHFEAQIKRVLVERKLRFQADFLRR